MKPKAGPAATLGGRPPAAVAVPAAATIVARQTVATTAASTDLEFIFAPFVSVSDLGRRRQMMHDCFRMVNGAV